MFFVPSLLQISSETHPCMHHDPALCPHFTGLILHFELQNWGGGIVSLESHIKRRKERGRALWIASVCATHFHTPHSIWGWRVGCHRCFPDEEIIEAKRGGGHIVIPLLWKHPQFLWETIFLLYLGPWGWGGTDTDLTNQSISTTWSVIGSGMNMWSRLSQWDSVPVYLFHCGTENLSVALQTAGDYLAIVWVETAWKWSPSGEWEAKRWRVERDKPSPDCVVQLCLEPMNCSFFSWAILEFCHL